MFLLVTGLAQIFLFHHILCRNNDRYLTYFRSISVSRHQKSLDGYVHCKIIFFYCGDFESFTRNFKIEVFIWNPNNCFLNVLLKVYRAGSLEFLFILPGEKTSSIWWNRVKTSLFKLCQMNLLASMSKSPVRYKCDSQVVLKWCQKTRF